MSFFITGIDTGVGKTVVAAIITKALGARYWKPIQCGDLESSDSMMVGELAQLKRGDIVPERYQFSLPQSPHLAAHRDGVTISIDDFTLPDDKGRPFVVEGVGGVLVPLNGCVTLLEIMKRLNLPVIVVVKHYLGSINHTLLTLECLKRASLNVVGMVISGEENSSSEEIIEAHSGVNIIFRVKHHREMTAQVVARYADSWGRPLDVEKRGSIESMD